MKEAKLHRLRQIALAVARHRMGNAQGLIDEEEILTDEDKQLAVHVVRIWKGHESEYER